VGSKVIRNVTKILKATSGRLFGRVTSGTGRAEEITPSDARTLLSVYSTTQIDTSLSSKADLVGGVIPTAQIPAIAITEYLGNVASESAMLALVGDRGDWCLRSDLGTTWVLSADDSTLLASWTQLLYPTAPVTSVAGRTGAVTLNNTDISGLGTLATQSGTFSGTSSGTNTGDQTTISGNAGSATVLQTARTINGVSFDGSSNITVTAAGSTLSDTVTVAKGGTGLTALGTALQVLRVNAGATALEYAAAGGGIGGATGATDNSVLRADGTGGATLQNSAFVIADNATASPNNTVNHASIQATGGTTNVSVSIVPKGTGAFCLQVPDGGTGGGNVRGANAIDLQTNRSSASQVASGDYSFAANRKNIASGRDSAAFNDSNTSSGNSTATFGEASINAGRAAIVTGGGHNTTASVAVIGGYRHTSSGSACASFGCDVLADMQNQLAVGGTRFSTNGDNQVTIAIPLRVATSDATPTEMLIGSSWDGNTTRLTLRNNSAWAFEVTIIARSTSGANHASFIRRGLIFRNANAASTTLEGSVQTIGTDIASAGASTWSIAVTADTTNGSLKVAFTGQAATSIRATGAIRMAEVGFA
jgi:hypothetical protein